MEMLLCVDRWVDLVKEIMAVKSLQWLTIDVWAQLLVTMEHFFKAPCKYN